MEKILFIGDCGNFKNTSNGVYAKNIQLFNRLKEVFVTLKHVNTNNWKKNPSVLLNVLRFIWQYRKKNIIISLNTYSSYKLIKIVKMLFPSIRLNYFVIGGILPNFISQLEMKQRECYSIVKWFMVESQEMKHKMELLGYKNVIHIPNFKKIAYIPEKSIEIPVPFRFVFLSRIIPEKGCDLIIEATRRINKEIGEDKFIVHFYGKIEDSLKIKERKNPYYVKKSVREQIYLDQSQRFYLQKIADENHVGITIVLFQALITYCVFLSN